MFKTLLSRRSEEPFFLITVLLLIIIAVYNWVIALLALILIGGAYVLTRKNHNERNREISQFFDAISKSVDQASTYAVQNLPIGIAIIDMQSNLCWANSVFRDWVGDIDNDQQLDHIMPNLKVDKFWGKSGYFFEHIGERYYRVVYKYLQTEAADDDNYLILYFEDITDTERQKLNSLAAVPVFCDIEIDNLEEVAKGMTAVQRATLVTNVNNCLIGELSGHNCFIWAYGNEKYIACMSRDTLEYYKEDNFSFLEKIRSIHTVNRIPVTLSMGIALFPSDVIAAGKANFNELATKARAGLDLALGRGGDQVVVRNRLDFEFYGGKTKSTEKRTKVKSRVMANALGELISDASQVFIMGHKHADFDAVGAAAGVCCIARKRGKKAQIVIDMEDNVAKPLLSKLAALPEYKDAFISGNDAFISAQPGALLVVVDTNRPDFVESEQLLDACNRVAVIDHHRRAANYIESAALNFHEPYASSASELVTELLQYLADPTDLLRAESEALLAGIVLDTKNFTMRTGGRTFEAAAFLRRAGADTSDVQRLFQSDLAGMVERYDIIRHAELVHGDIAVAAVEKEIDRVTAAKAADELLTLSGIHASFVLFKNGTGVNLSARSLGEINVQFIMEKLGGGGNSTTAGGQVNDATVDEVRERLLAAIDEYMEE